MNSVFEWIFAHVAGIRPDAAQPGYKHFFVAPKLGGGLTSMRSAYDSVRGRIESAYEIADGMMTIRITVPPNTTATVTLPADSLEKATESDRPVAEAPGVTVVDSEAGTLTVRSGHYAFVLPKAAIP
jgi:alpha-L-rhamnosidase